MFLSGFIKQRKLLAVAAILVLTGIPAATVKEAEAGSHQHLINLNRVDFEVPVQIMRNARVKLHNNWGVPLHDTTIRQMASGSRLAKIETIIAGQTVTLEFPKDGAYSVCYLFEKNESETKNRCLFLKVIPMNAT